MWRIARSAMVGLLSLIFMAACVKAKDPISATVLGTYTTTIDGNSSLTKLIERAGYKHVNKNITEDSFSMTLTKDIVQRKVHVVGLSMFADYDEILGLLGQKRLRLASISELISLMQQHSGLQVGGEGVLVFSPTLKTWCGNRGVAVVKFGAKNRLSFGYYGYNYSNHYRLAAVPVT
ncbi:MAG: hypothetical protein AAB930_04190 [Patescibacteria group bacterium]